MAKGALFGADREVFLKPGMKGLALDKSWVRSLMRWYLKALSTATQSGQLLATNAHTYTFPRTSLVRLT